MPKLKQYDKSKLENALSDIRNGTESYRTAEKKYGIPKSTLEFKLKHPGHKESLGPSPILTSEEEALLVSWIKDNASKGFPKKANDLKSSVQKFLIANPRPHKFKNNRPGDGWVKGFLKRHPEISKRTSEGVTSASACVSEQDIRNWFANIYDYIKEKNLEEVLKDPSRIFNGDESGFQVCPSTGKVFAAKGSKNVYSVERSSAKESITVMFTFSADGSICVPMVIYPYQRIPEKVAKSINPKWGVGRSDNGWMTSETFYQYIANVFYPHLKENAVKLPVILFLDGHKSHLNYQLSLLCNELQIEVISLYPNATRILQPCDVSIFRPMKEAWRQSVRQWEEQHPGEVVNKVVFARILERAVDMSVKTETIVNGFRACGLHPFDPNAIDYTKCLGVKEPVQDVSNIQENEINTSMNYETFATIVGPERIKMFQQFNEVNKISDENFNLLFKIWSFFQNNNKSNIANFNSEELERKSTINILQNIVITSPLKEPQIASSQNKQTTNTYFQPSSSKVTVESSILSVSENEANNYFQPTTSNKVIVKNNLLGSFLESPSAPERKGKRNIERFPFAITSERYQQMFRKKEELKKEQEKQKEDRKRKRQEKQNQKQCKGKNLKKLIQCSVCLKDIKSDELKCDDCKNYFHQKCIPANHSQYIPSEDDLFICHNCYKLSDSDEDVFEDENDEEEIDELFEKYKMTQKTLYK